MINNYVINFVIYSFLGWILEEIFAAFKYGKFINRGFMNGPLCPVYGFSMIIVISNLRDLAEYPIIQFIEAVIIVTVMEYITGALMLRITGKRLWDYSNKKVNLNGYICLEYSVLWGTCAVIVFWLVHPFLYIASQLIPLSVKNVIVIVCCVLFLCDLVVTIGAVFKWRKKENVPKNVAERLSEAKYKLGESIFSKIQRRMYRSFPELTKEKPSDTDGFGKVKKQVFAKGLCFDKLVWLFFVSALVGDWIETLFVWTTTGEFMSRSSLLYGTFSIVWGLGGAIGTGLLYSLRNKNDRYIFIGGFLIGGAYEYSCSVFTEVVFGTVFWDYSNIPFNLNGRVNLLYCFFWGIIAIVWIKLLYPVVSKIIGKIPVVAGKIVTYLIVVTMVLDMLVSGLAISRFVHRNAKINGDYAIEKFLDYTYPDKLIEQIYPNMKIK